MELYAGIRSRLEGRPVSPSEGQAVLRNLYVAPTMETARQEAEAPILSAFIYNDPFRGREVFTNPGEELRPGTKLDWEFLEPRNLLVGSPEHVAERVQELAEVCGLETLLVEHAHPGIPQRLILRNLELFATKVMALMIGAMIIQGIQPGPSVITEQPALFWGMIVSMWLGNLFLVVLNLPLIGLWVRLITVPYHLLYPSILVFCAIGVFSLNNSEFDVYLMALFGVVGYVLARLGCEPAPLLLAFILGPLMEEYLRRAMLLSRGNPWVFVTRPISATLLVLAGLAMCAVLLPAFGRTRKEAF